MMIKLLRQELAEVKAFAASHIGQDIGIVASLGPAAWQ